MSKPYFFLADDELDHGMTKVAWLFGSDGHARHVIAEEVDALPELLEACKAALKELEGRQAEADDWNNNQPGVGKNGPGWKLINTIRAAIAKAEGRDPNDR